MAFQVKTQDEEWKLRWNERVGGGGAIEMRWIWSMHFDPHGTLLIQPSEYREGRSDFVQTGQLDRVRKGEAKCSIFPNIHLFQYNPSLKSELWFNVIFRILVNLRASRFSKQNTQQWKIFETTILQRKILQGKTWHTPLAPPQLGRVHSQDQPRQYPIFSPQTRAYILSSRAQPIPRTNVPQFSICQYIPSVQ